MNTYEITFQRENGTTGSDRFTAATEAQARRDFREVYRHGNEQITKVELISSDSPATKEQERKAVEKIRKIINDLGNGSYVGTALEGCLEDAESNIENDFSDSMKSRFEHSEKRLREAQGRIAELEDKLSESEKDYEAAHAAAHQIAEEKDTEIAALRERVLSSDDLETLLSLVTERISSLDSEVQNAAERIVESAGEPESAAFKNAVNDHRAAKRASDKYKMLLERAAKSKR